MTSKHKKVLAVVIAVLAVVAGIAAAVTGSTDNGKSDVVIAADEDESRARSDQRPKTTADTDDSTTSTSAKDAESADSDGRDTPTGDGPSNSGTDATTSTGPADNGTTTGHKPTSSRPSTTKPSSSTTPKSPAKPAPGAPSKTAPKPTPTTQAPPPPPPPPPTTQAPPPPPPPPPPTTTVPVGSTRDTAAEAQYLAKLNARRASQGLPALSRVACLDSVAVGWSAHLGQVRQLAHNPNYVSQTEQSCGANWLGVAENVGYAVSVDILDSSFWNSPGHRANIVGDFNKVGIGVYRSHGNLWITVNFLKS